MRTEEERLARVVREAAKLGAKVVVPAPIVEGQEGGVVEVGSNGLPDGQFTERERAWADRCAPPLGLDPEDERLLVAVRDDVNAVNRLAAEAESWRARGVEGRALELGRMVVGGLARQQAEVVNEAACLSVATFKGR